MRVDGAEPPVAARPPAPERAASAATLLAFVELRLRLLLRKLRGRGGVPELVGRIAAYVIVLPAALVLAALTASGSYKAARAGSGFVVDVSVTALYFGIWQTWTAVALSLSERDAVDLRRLLVYPLPPARVYAYGVVASVVGDPFAIFWCVLLGGAFVGAALARPGAWLLLLALVLALFIAATASLVALAQELLGRLVRGRRMREVAIAVVYVGTAFALAALSGEGRRAPLRAVEALQRVQWLAFPAALGSAAARALYRGRIDGALPWVAALAGATVASGWAAYRLALGTALSGGEAPRTGAGAHARGWPLGALPGRMGPLLEKEAKYLARHPLASVLALVIPAFAGFVGWKLAPRIPVEAGEVVRALPIFGFALYAHLATQVFWLNAFGWERGGARIYFLAPVPPTEVVVAKSAATYGLSLALFAASTAAAIVVGGAPPPWAIAAAVALHAGVTPWLHGPGLLVSILNPRAAPFAVQRGGALSSMSGLAGMGIVSAVSALFAVPVLLALRLDRPWVLTAAWAALGLVGAALYRVALPRLGRLAVARREPLLAAVCGDED